MAYTRIVEPTTKIPLEPAVLTVDLTAGTDGGALDNLVYVPWKNCKLAYAYVITTVAEADKGTVAVKLELNAASGTVIGTITVLKNAGVGDVAELSAFTYEYAGENLHSDVTLRDAINIETDGANTTTWAGTLFMYFVPNYKA
jgi:hypothetical protein